MSKPITDLPIDRELLKRICAMKVDSREDVLKNREAERLQIIFDILRRSNMVVAGIGGD